MCVARRSGVEVCECDRKREYIKATGGGKEEMEEEGVGGGEGTEPSNRLK